MSHSWSPGQLLGHLNWIGVSALVLLALAAAAAVLWRAGPSRPGGEAAGEADTAAAGCSEFVVPARRGRSV